MSDEQTTITNLEDALEALKNARKDAAAQRTRAKTLQENLDALMAERDDLQAKLKDAEEGADSVAALIEEITDRTGLDFSGLEGAKTDEDVSKALDAAFKPLTDRLSRAEQADTLERTLALTKAATALSVGEADLTEWLAGRDLKVGTVKNAEGQDVEAFGITVKDGDADTFKPLTEFKTFTALTGNQQPEPPRTQFPKQETKGDPAPAKTVEARTQELRGQITI
jgi:predicted RNase H-like nuclease (RuvC/YqgF family)